MWSNREICHSYFTRYAESEFHNPRVLQLKWKFHCRFYKVFFHRLQHKEKLKFQKQLLDKDIYIMVVQTFMWNWPSKTAPYSFFFFFFVSFFKMCHASIFRGAKICRKSLFCKGATSDGICPPFSVWNNVILKYS